MPNKGDRFLAKSILPNLVDQEVIFEGIQEVGLDDYPSFPIYTITQRIYTHPAGSTLSKDTIEAYGFVLESEAP